MAKADGDVHSKSPPRFIVALPNCLGVPRSGFPIASLKSKPLIDERPKRFRTAPIRPPARWPFSSSESELCTSHPPHRKLEGIFPSPSVSLPQAKQVSSLYKGSIVHDRHFFVRKLSAHSTAKEIVKFGAPRCLVATAALRIRILRGS